MQKLTQVGTVPLAVSGVWRVVFLRWRHSLTWLIPPSILARPSHWA